VEPVDHGGVHPGVVWLLALAYVVTVGCFVVAAWIAGIAGIYDTCQGRDYSGTELALVIAGIAGVAISAALTRYSIRRRS
jgi:hypothetical protein